ncbi:MAG: ketoacyl-ACP synthase III [Candidatus Nitronauta litoralis]|uniref:Beta-ketoacyl-[acyl-carrier-protein] synthase III n=1 Tax=Candidatus Nitronauta litoralis TaxID=2705533 RepID=A0A7T0G1U1_9BACT|nr:MAG: ketoacyl-ACP synthase III [Candidatus Nitronauta litoralis]
MHIPYKARIAGTGSCLPDRVVTNLDLEKTLDTSDQWIRERTGIAERRIAEKGESSSTLGAEAARRALARAGVNAEDIDMIIVCTSTPDVIYPSTACFVQRELGASKAAAFDISAVCSGFVFGLSVAEQYIKSGRYETILVIGAEVNSRLMDWTDRSTCILFGDGAGAVVLKREESEEPVGILSSHIYSDGNRAEMLIVPGGIGRETISKQAVEDKLYTLKMEGQATFKIAVKKMTAVSMEALSLNGFSKEDLTVMVPHQANRRIIDAVADKLKMDPSKVIVNLNKLGNTGGASIPIALNQAVENNQIKNGDLVLLTVLGAGLTWGAALIRW